MQLKSYLPFSDNIANNFGYNNLAAFSTFDRDLDFGGPRNCAVDRHGAWWYKTCTYVNLNGLNVQPGETCKLAGAETGACAHLHGGFKSGGKLRRSSMMLRRT
jgi:hypothetical protein